MENLKCKGVLSVAVLLMCFSNLVPAATDVNLGNKTADDIILVYGDQPNIDCNSANRISLSSNTSAKEDLTADVSKFLYFKIYIRSEHKPDCETSAASYRLCDMGRSNSQDVFGTMLPLTGTIEVNVNGNTKKCRASVFYSGVDY